jgi:enterochelin esterase-like enzyme
MLKKQKNMFLVLVTLILFHFSGVLGHASLLETMKFNSKFLKREYIASVYLPYRYKSSGLKYPVIYLLHGALGDEKSWLESGNIRRTADTLMAEGKIPPSILVMPSHFNAWWVNGNREPAESVFFEEVVPTVEKKYHTIKHRSGRAVAGVSAGGYGSILYIFKHPEMFAAAAALSPAIYSPLPPANSPAISSHPFIDANRKFEEETWKRLNYPEYITAYLSRGVIVPLYINSGDDDRFDTAYHAAVLFNRLRVYQPKNLEFRVVNGDHDWDVWSKTISDALIYMAQFMSQPVRQDQKLPSK